MKSIAILISSLFLFAACSGCTPIAAYQAVSSQDTTPPLILSCSATGVREITITCSEAAEADADTFSLGEDITLEGIIVTDETIRLTTAEELIPGGVYELTGRICDTAGNSSMAYLSVYGWNPSPPGMIINEFTTKGSKRHPDAVELYVTSAGNTAGVCLFDGTAGDFRQKCILPALEVTKGEYLIIHCTDTPEAFDAERQFSMEEPVGLSGNNGVLSLYTSCSGNLMDAVVYSNRFSDSDEKYQGFGSTLMLEKVKYLVGEGAWGSLKPEGAVRSTKTTATRSACRASVPKDTDSAADWHTVPTSGSTFGEVNSDEVYE